MLSKVSFAAAVFASVACAEQELFVNPEDELRELQPPPPGLSSLGWRYGYCRMQKNPAFDVGTNPWGYFRLREQNEYAPMEIKGYMFNMPPPTSQHGFSINTNLFNGRDCRTTEPTYDPFNQPYGQMNSWPSQVGDLFPVIDSNGPGGAYYNKIAW